MRDQDELILIYRKTVRPLYTFVSKRVGGDRALAEDIVQETWMRAVANWPRRGLPERPLAWLMTVARNLLISDSRRARPRPVDPVELDLEDERFVPGTPEAAALVGWGLARLRRPQAELIEAYHFEGRTIGEIAADTGLTERAVEGRLRRARLKLKKRLERHIRCDLEASSPAASTGSRSETAAPCDGAD